MTGQVHIDSQTKRLSRVPLKASHAPHILRALDAVAAKRTYRRGEEVCNSTCISDCLYRVTSGAAKRCATFPKGRQQIVDLLLPDDIFACAPNAHHSFSIEGAATETVLTCYSRRRVETLAESDSRIAKLLSEIAFEAVCRLEAQLLILGRTTALEKIGAFLVELSDRQSGRSNSVVLPVSRYDIADYLALSVETVSRSLTGLKERGLISSIGTRSIKIIDRDALDDVTSC
jgi:CRP-like cAMP-binding protein